MKTFLLASCLFVLSIYIKSSKSETEISHVVRTKRSRNGQLSQESFNIVINEKGSQFNENVNFDMKKKTATYHIPAHRDLAESVYLFDFKSNITATRVRESGVCYVRPRSPDEPSLDELRRSMDMVANQKYKMRSGSRLLSAQWTPKKELDSSKLSKNIAELCRGMRIYELVKVEQNGVAVVNKVQGIARTKRSLGFSLCQAPSHYDLRSCRTQNYITKCKFSSKSCVYWVTCTGGIHGVRDSGGNVCDSSHELLNAICCDISCP